MGSDLQHVQAEPVGGPGLRRTAATFGVARARERRRGAPRVLLLAGAPPVVLAQRVVDVDDAVATVRPVDGPDLRAKKTGGHAAVSRHEQRTVVAVLHARRNLEQHA